MAYWWVNQNKTWRYEIPGEYLWSPTLTTHGRHIQSYDNMLLLTPEDIVFSYVSGAIKYAGVVVNRAEPSKRPDFGFTTNQWNDDGWAVEMRYFPFGPTRPQDHLEQYNARPLKTHAPMNAGGVVMSQYLFALDDHFGSYLFRVAHMEEHDLRHAVHDESHDDPTPEDTADQFNDPNLSSTERRQLIKARVGQGLFKEEVRRIEPVCRLTGLREPGHLVASHMKPWSRSTNAERLDGSNGLLLSPHVDHLFDRGLITFKNDGSVVVSKTLEPSVPELWKLDLTQDGRKFRQSQIPYLDFHRDEIFETGWSI